MGSTGGLVRTPILSGEAYRGPRSVYSEESLDDLSAHRERAEPDLGRTGKYAPYAVVFTNVVMADFNMLGAPMRNCVVAHMDSALIVLEDQRRRGLRSPKAVEKVSNVQR